MSTPASQQARHKSLPLTDAQKAEIKERYTEGLPIRQLDTRRAGKHTMASLAKEYGVSVSVVFRAIHRPAAE